MDFEELITYVVFQIDKFMINSKYLLMFINAEAYISFVCKLF